MKTPLLEMTHEFYVDETDVTEAAAARGWRSARSRPIDVGRTCILYFVSRIVGADGRPFTQPMKVRITARHKRVPTRYRGELLDKPDRALFHPRDLRIGSILEFTNAHVVYAGR